MYLGSRYPVKGRDPEVECRGNKRSSTLWNQDTRQGHECWQTFWRHFHIMSIWRGEHEQEQEQEQKQEQEQEQEQ